MAADCGREGAPYEFDSEVDPRSLPLFADLPAPDEPTTSSGLGSIAPASVGALGALALLRAADAGGEASARVLALADAVITHVNPADYSAWCMRWRVARELQAPLESDAALTARVAALHGTKNYQLWHHRAQLAAAAGPAGAERELAFADAALADDPKNYHAWAHRAAVAAMHGLWEGELEYAAGALGEDGRNNSAWAHRAAAAAALTAAGADAAAAADRELALAAQAAAVDPYDAPPWDHARAAAALAGPATLAADPRFAALAVAALTVAPGSVPALLFAHECYEARAAAAGDAADAAANAAAAADCRDRLAAADPGRAGLWAALAR